MKKGYLLLSFSLFFSVAFAQTEWQWNSTTTKNWQDGNNWFITSGTADPGETWPGQVDGSNDNVTVPGGMGIANLIVAVSGVSINSFTINGGRVTFANRTLTVTNLQLVDGELTVNGSNADGELIVTGDVTQGGGVFRVNNNNVGQPNKFRLEGDFTKTGGTSSFAGEVELAGGNTQTFDAGGAVSFPNLILNKAGGSVVNFPVSTDVTINGNVALNGGIITNTNPIIFQAAGGTYTGGSANSYIDGPVLKRGSTAFAYPVGKGGVYAPLTIGVLSGFSDVTVTYFRTNPKAVFGTGIATQSPASAQLADVSSLEYWEVSPNNNRSAELTAFYNNNSGSGEITDDSAIKLAKWNSAASEWENQSGPSSIEGGEEGTGSTISTDGSVSIAGTYTIATTDAIANVLPVELLHFSAAPRGDRVELSWATASEIDHAAFVVERSRGGKVFEYVGKVASDGQDRYTTREYALMDKQPLPGTSYYRLVQIDLDGTTTYSDIVAVFLGDTGAPKDGVTLFPNPGRELVTLSSQDRLDNAELFLFNAAGQQVPLRYTAQEYQMEIPVRQLPAGLYFLQVLRPGQAPLTQRLVVQE